MNDEARSIRLLRRAAQGAVAGAAGGCVARYKGSLMPETIITTTVSQDIETRKVNINKLFTEFWFRVPEYQRSYVWGKDEIDELLYQLQVKEKEIRNHRGSVASEIQAIKRSVNKLERDAEDLVRMQQTNRALIGKKLS